MINNCTKRFDISNLSDERPCCGLKAVGTVPSCHTGKAALSWNNVKFLKFVDKLARLDCFKSWRKYGINVDDGFVDRNNKLSSVLLESKKIDYSGA